MQPNFIGQLLGRVVGSVVDLFGAWLFVFALLIGIALVASVWRRLKSVG